MKSRYLLALVALVAAQSSSGFTVFLDGEKYPGVNDIQIVADDSPRPPVDPPGPPPVNPPPSTDPDPNTPPVPDSCLVPEGVIEKDMPQVWTPYKIKRNQSVALAFDRQHFSRGFGSISFAENIQGPSPLKQAVISACPGDFTVKSGCAKEAFNERILVDFSGQFKKNPGVCSLEPGQTYWFNIRHFDMRNGQDTCPKGKTCVLTVRP
ncbi:hypothetical protein [Nitrosococcus watsonii]|uniref:Uncharacterized protein n=1 Tax=Nitrosococcus watsoni (strain C-113) TaxID=105559 RepID=D8K928_NITWC|nr:hypothetical protein [Nitrosococcus watsonii]ADJ29171.1 conserved hypothetical protein [Nitrosococcus watsonii C-113]